MAMACRNCNGPDCVKSYTYRAHEVQPMPSRTVMNDTGCSSFARFKSLYIIAGTRPTANTPRITIVISYHPLP